MTEQQQNDIVFYKPKGKAPILQVNLTQNTVWLNQQQISHLFKTDRSVITKHINNIYRTKELLSESTCAKFAQVQTEGRRMVKRSIFHYNLDVIISVGYRINSKVATQFRIWATNILRDYIVKGYAVNQKRLRQAEQHLVELSKTVKVMQNVADTRKLSRSETQGLFKIISDFTYGLQVLDDFDRNQLKVTGTKKKLLFILDYESARRSIQTMKRQIQSKGEELGLFGIEKDKSLEGSLKNIYQTIDGVDAYPTIEEKTAHLLYFIIKNHPFVDGNKRIAASLFLWFLDGNRCLYKRDGSRRIVDNALVALTLMVASSRPEDKDIIIKVIVNLINRNN